MKELSVYSAFWLFVKRLFYALFLQSDPREIPKIILLLYSDNIHKYTSVYVMKSGLKLGE